MLDPRATLGLVASLALACSLRPYSVDSDTGTSTAASSTGDTAPITTDSASSAGSTTMAPVTSTGGPIQGTWRGVYTYGEDGVHIFGEVFVDCATQQSYTLVLADIPSYCRKLGPEGFYLHFTGVLHPDGDDEDLLDDLEVTTVLEGPCNTGSCEDAPAWSECGTWVDACGCDPFLQNCPEGEKCAPYSNDGDNSWDALQCVPVMPGAGGTAEPCMGDGSTGIDTCAKGHVCLSTSEADPVCVPQCPGTYDAPEECPTCSACTISANGILTVCLIDCSPLRDDCYSGGVCVPFPQDPLRMLCINDASGDEGQVFDPCTDYDTCDPGLWCAPSAHASECDQQAAGCCLPFCDLGQPSCPGAGQVCVPWYDPDAPPTCDGTLGHCRLP